MFSSNPKEILALLSVTIRTKLCLHYEIMYFFLPEINRFCSANMLFIFLGFLFGSVIVEIVSILYIRMSINMRKNHVGSPHFIFCL